MNKTEFKIDKVKFENGSEKCYIFYKSFHLFGFPRWKLYQILDFDDISIAEAWLDNDLKQKEMSRVEPYVTDRKFVTI